MGSTGTAGAAGRACVLGVLAALAGACAPPAPPPVVAAGMGEGPARAWLAARTEAEAAMRRGEWERAGESLREAVRLYPANLTEALRRLRAEDYYNLGCVRALAGKKPEALDALEVAMADGFDVVDYDHLVADPDLDPVRGEPRFRALVERISFNGEVELLPPSGGASGPHPLVVLLRPYPWLGEKDATTLADEARARGWAVAIPRPPYRTGRDVYAWRTRREAGAAAARKAVLAIEAAAKAFPVDRSRVVLAAEGREAGVAWEVLLREPGPWSGAVLGGEPPPDAVIADRESGLLERRPRIFVVGPFPASTEKRAALALGLVHRGGSTASALQDLAGRAKK